MKKVKSTDADPNIGTLQVDEELVADTSQKPEILNDFFGNVRYKLAENFNTTDQKKVRLQHLHRVTPTTVFIPQGSVLRSEIM